MASKFTITQSDVLLVADVQNDFCPGGLLPVPAGAEIVAPVNRLARSFHHVVLTQDWHPPGHYSFASSHKGRKPYEIIEASYGEQVLWPNHCIQETSGARFHGELEIPHAELILRKGFRPHIDSYSAFFENDRATPTGLGGYLRERGFSRVFIAGLALDYCVRYSAEDALAQGFTAIIVEDACRAMEAAGSLAAAQKSFSDRGIELAGTHAID